MKLWQQPDDDSTTRRNPSAWPALPTRDPAIRLPQTAPLSAEGRDEGALGGEGFLDAGAVEVFAELLERGGFAEELRGGVARGERGGVGGVLGEVEFGGALLLAEGVGPPVLADGEQVGARAQVAGLGQRLVVILAVVEPSVGVAGLLVVLFVGFVGGVGFVADGFLRLGEEVLEIADESEDVRNLRALVAGVGAQGVVALGFRRADASGSADAPYASVPWRREPRRLRVDILSRGQDSRGESVYSPP